MLGRLSAEVGADRALLLRCGAHGNSAGPNITVRKISDAGLEKCEWGRNDYSVRISGPPVAPPDSEAAETVADDAAPARPDRAPKRGRIAGPKGDRTRLQPCLLEVREKGGAAAVSCGHATEHARTTDGKPWRHLLLPDDRIQETMRLAGFVGSCRLLPQR